jgi:hypothetical protein
MAFALANISRSFSSNSCTVCSILATVITVGATAWASPFTLLLQQGSAIGNCSVSVPNLSNFREKCPTPQNDDLGPQSTVLTPPNATWEKQARVFLAPPLSRSELRGVSGDSLRYALSERAGGVRWPPSDTLLFAR